MKMWLMFTVIISLGTSNKDLPLPIVKFTDETYPTEEACVKAAKELGWYESKHQIIAFCVEGTAILISPKQYVPRPKK